MIEDHLVVEGNGDHQEIEGHLEGSGVEEAEVVEEDTEMVVGMEVETEVEEEGEGHLLEVLRPKVSSRWKRGKSSIHSGIFGQCSSRVLEQWLPK
jgi:hypothetical protein